MTNPKARNEPEGGTTSQSGRALLELREALLRGDFRPGERISELPLVARLGVSRTPIRFALDRLAHEGLLDLAPSGGFMVREFTLDDIWEAIELRGVLEGNAARLAAERLESDHDLDVLRKYQDEMAAFRTSTMETLPQYLELNEAFHATLVDLAKNQTLRRAIDQAKALPFASPSALVFARSRLPRALDLFVISNEQHSAIVEAIAKRHGSRAESLTREHSLLARRNLELALSQENVWSAVPGASLVRLSSRGKSGR